MSPDELVELEERGWRALADGPQAAAAFYEQTLDDQVVMLFPGGIRMADRAAIIASMGGPPWAGYELEDPQVLRPTPDTGLVTYGVVAHREGSPPCSALISTLYVRRGDGWKLASHQQTPR
jgi:Domain of unknown function (DUF4440)